MKGFWSRRDTVASKASHFFSAAPQLYQFMSVLQLKYLKWKEVMISKEPSLWDCLVRSSLVCPTGRTSSQKLLCSAALAQLRFLPTTVLCSPGSTSPSLRHSCASKNWRQEKDNKWPHKLACLPNLCTHGIGAFSYIWYETQQLLIKNWLVQLPA